MPKRKRDIRAELDTLHEREHAFRLKGWFYDANRLAIQWYKLARKTEHNLPDRYIASQIAFFQAINAKIPPKLRRPMGITTLLHPSSKSRKRK